MDVFVGRMFVNVIDGILLILVGGIDEQIVCVCLIFMCMGNELVEVGGSGMGICVKLINNYMSIVFNVLFFEVVVLCELLGLNFDVVIKVMSGMVVGKGYFMIIWFCKVLKGDFLFVFMVDLVLKDLCIVVDVVWEMGVLFNMGIVVESYYVVVS